MRRGAIKKGFNKAGIEMYLFPGMCMGARQGSQNRQKITRGTNITPTIYKDIAQGMASSGERREKQH